MKDIWFTLKILEDFRVWEFFLLLAGEGFRTLWVVWPCAGFRKEVSLAPVQPCFALVQPSLAPMLQAFGPHAPKHLLHLQRTTKDLKIEGSRSQQGSVTDHPPLSDCTETQ